MKSTELKSRTKELHRKEKGETVCNRRATAGVGQPRSQPDLQQQRRPHLSFIRPRSEDSLGETRSLLKGREKRKRRRRRRKDCTCLLLSSAFTLPLSSAFCRLGSLFHPFSHTTPEACRRFCGRRCGALRLPEDVRAKPFRACISRGEGQQRALSRLSLSALQPRCAQCCLRECVRSEAPTAPRGAT